MVEGGFKIPSFSELVPPEKRVKLYFEEQVTSKLPALEEGKGLEIAPEKIRQDIEEMHLQLPIALFWSAADGTQKNRIAPDEKRLIELISEAAQDAVTLSNANKGFWFDTGRAERVTPQRP